MKSKILEETKDMSNLQLKILMKEVIQEAMQEEKKYKATLTIEECVKYSGIGRDKIIELAHGNNDFPSFRVGVRFLVNKELLDKWLEKVSKEKTIL